MDPDFSGSDDQQSEALRRIDEMSEEELLATAYQRGMLPGQETRKRAKYVPREKWTTFDETKRHEFLVALSESGNISYALNKVGAKKATFDKYRRENPEFVDHVDDAIAHFKSIVEGAAHNRAIDGYVVPVIGGRNKDSVVAYERRYSDGLMSMMLKKIDPAYNPTQKVEVEQKPGGLIDPRDVDFRKMSRRAKRVLRVLLQVIKEDDAMRAQGIDPNSVLVNQPVNGVLPDFPENVIEAQSEDVESDDA